MADGQTIDPGKALAAYDPRQYQVIARQEDLVALSKLVIIDLVAIDLGECANVGGKFMPSREKTDQIGAAAGITFVEASCAVTKIDRCVWVGRATARRMARDGSTQTMVAEYEWDAELRAEVVAKATSGPKYDSALAQGRLFGRQRADTGARLRVIRMLAGIPTAFKQADLKRPLVLARCSRDTEAMMKEPALRDLLVKQMIGATGDVFGPMRDVTPEPAALPDVPETPLDEETAEAVADEIVDDEVSGGVFPDDRGASRSRRLSRPGSKTCSAMRAAMRTWSWNARGCRRSSPRGWGRRARNR